MSTQKWPISTTNIMVPCVSCVDSQCVRFTYVTVKFFKMTWFSLAVFMYTWYYRIGQEVGNVCLCIFIPQPLNITNLPNAGRFILRSTVPVTMAMGKLGIWSTWGMKVHKHTFPTSWPILQYHMYIKAANENTTLNMSFYGISLLCKSGSTNETQITIT